MTSFPRLLIEQQAAQIGIKTTNAVMHISRPQPKMHITNKMPEMKVEQKWPEFELNWDQVWAESGLTKPVRKVIDTAETAKVKTFEAIGQIAKEGDHLGKIELGGNRVAQIAKDKTLKESLKEINLGSMPQSLPEVTWDPGYINISWTNAVMQIEWDMEGYPPSITVEPHSIEIFLRNRPYIKITVTEEGIQKQVGRQIDKNI